MDLEAVLVTDHQQGGILQVFPVLFKLEISGVKVFVLALVFPSEAAALPINRIDELLPWNLTDALQPVA
jgi:hypothetical protein